MSKLKRKFKNLVFITIIICGFILFDKSAESVDGIIKAENTVEVPIIMYHSVLKDPERTGKYVITPKQFEEDLIYLKNNGYTTITVNDLIDWVYDGKSLPDKPIILTFDDGYYNNYLYVFPLLKQYECKAVMSVIGNYTDQYSESGEKNAYYSHITWDMVSEMLESGNIEIANHSYDMHTLNKGRKGSNKKKEESYEVYKSTFERDLEEFQKKIEEKTGYIPRTYTYPYGSVSKDSLNFVKELGFYASLSCAEGKNYLTGDKEELYLLKRYIRTGFDETSKFFAKFK